MIILIVDLVIDSIRYSNLSSAGSIGISTSIALFFYIVEGSLRSQEACAPDSPDLAVHCETKLAAKAKCDLGSELEKLG